jgi:TRAP-type mannitol/chloroaromatic compound transport system permease large subunit
LLAATTGVVAASVISMGLISLPIMLRYGYDRRLASGVIAASGTLAQIIPPSLVLIVLADQLGRSVGDMYEGAFIPGLVLAALYAGYVFLVTIVYPARARPAAGSADAARRRRPDAAPLAAGGHDHLLRHRLRLYEALHQGRCRRRLRRADDVDRGRRLLRDRAHQQGLGSTCSRA